MKLLLVVLLIPLTCSAITITCLSESDTLAVLTIFTDSTARVDIWYPTRAFAVGEYWYIVDVFNKEIYDFQEVLINRAISNVGTMCYVPIRVGVVGYGIPVGNSGIINPIRFIVNY